MKGFGKGSAGRFATADQVVRVNIAAAAAIAELEVLAAARPPTPADQNGSRTLAIDVLLV